MKALGAHIYAGGFTEGLRRHLDVVGHLETSKFGVETAKLNLGVDVRIDPALGSEPYKGMNLDVVYGNPPCVAFSQLGFKAGMAHPTIADLKAFIRLGQELQPKIWAWECVQQVWTKGNELVMGAIKSWNELGYFCHVFMTDANLHGASQRRHRFHLVASKVAIDWEIPKPENLGIPCGDVLMARLPEMDTKNLQVRRYLQWMEKYALPGHALRRIWFILHGLKGGVKPDGMRFCPPFCIQRLYGQGPSCTLTGGPDFIHPYEWRVLSPGEMARLSGFRPDWKWLGNPVNRYKEVAKGVTPVMGDYLGKTFRKALENDFSNYLTFKLHPEGYQVTNFTSMSSNVWKHLQIPKIPKEWWNICNIMQINPQHQADVVGA